MVTLLSLKCYFTSPGEDKEQLPCILRGFQVFLHEFSGPQHLPVFCTLIIFSQLWQNKVCHGIEVCHAHVHPSIHYGYLV